MMINNIFKNFSSLFFSNIIINLLSFLYTILLARYLGVEGFGVLSLALAFGGIFGIVTDLGLGSLSTREVSRNKSLAPEYLSNILVIRFILAILTFIVAVISLNLLDYSYQTKLVIYLITLSFIVAAITSTYYAIFQSYERMGYQALGQTLTSILLFTGILLAIYYSYDILIIALIYLLSNLIILLFNMIISPLYLDLKLKGINKKFWKPTIKTAIPFSLALIFSLIYFKVDTIILSLLKGEIAVGIYSAPYNLMMALMFIPITFTTVLFPLFSQLHIESHGSLKNSYEKTFKYLLITSIPIAVITTFYSNNIILLVYGLNFKSSILVLQILIWTVPLIFATYLFRTLLLAMNKQNLVFKIIIICLTLNIILNIILIPFYNFIGASFVNVLTEFVFFIICFHYIGKYLYKIPSKTIFKIMLSGVIMILIIDLFHELNLFIVITGSLILYTLSLLCLEVISYDELKKIIFK